MYEKISDTVSKVTSNKYVFWLDSGENGLSEHGQMILHFDQDPTKIQEFCTLLDENPNSAFITYVNKYI